MVFKPRPPSSFLPPINGLKDCSRKDIVNAIALLREIYIHPQVRGSTRRRAQRPTDSLLTGPHSTLSDHDLTLISADAFERSFSIQWLTRFISISSKQTFESEDDVAREADLLEQAASLLAVCAGAAAAGPIERVLTFPFDVSASYPHGTSDIAPAPFVEMNMAPNRFHDHDAGTADTGNIRVVLRDAPLESADFSSVGAQTWGGSCVLAEMIAETPEKFGIFRDFIDDSIASQSMGPPFRSLELGSGTGLASLVLGKVLERLRSSDANVHYLQEVGFPEFATQREPDVVVATDFHRSVLTNLQSNVERNFPYTTRSHSDTSLGSIYSTGSSFSRPHVAALPLDWSLIHDSPRVEPLTPFTMATSPDYDQSAPIAANLSLLDIPFDLIIGADIIYEPLHARWIRSCIERFLRKSDTISTPVASLFASSLAVNGREQQLVPALFHLIIPLRKTHSLESRTVEDVFPQASDVIAARLVAYRAISAPMDHRSDDIATSEPCVPPVLAVLSQEDIICDAYSDAERAEEVVYRYYKIGWV